MAALVVAVGVNVRQLPSIERSNTLSVAAPLEASDLTTVAANHASATREQFLLYLQLGDVAAGGRLTTSSDTGLLRDELLGLARLSRVDVTHYDPTIPAGLAQRLLAAAVARGEDRVVGPYAIVVPEEPKARAEPEIVTVTDGTTTLFVDRVLLPGGVATDG
jgi:hypothetical protein